MPFNQGQLNFDVDNGENGYSRWQEELAQQKKDLESRWGIILEKKVRATIKGYTRSIEGTLTLSTKKQTRNAPPLLRISTLEFTPMEIESIIRLDAPTLKQDS